MNVWWYLPMFQTEDCFDETGEARGSLGMTKVWLDLVTILAQGLRPIMS
jgi:hypothetical protein